MAFFISQGAIIFQKNDRGKRFEYLLKQTEIFSHFMTNQSKTSSSGSPIKQKGRPRKEPLSNMSEDPGEWVLFRDSFKVCFYD